MKTAIYLYRCRRCGEIDRSLRGPIERAVVLTVNATNGVLSELMAPRMHSIHICADSDSKAGNLTCGVSDFIGFEQEQPQ